MSLHSLPLAYNGHRLHDGTLLPRQCSLLSPHALQNVRIPNLTHILMALDPVPQRRLPQRLGHPSLPKRKLNIIQPSPILLQHPPPQFLNLLLHLSHPHILQILKLCVPAHALKERNAIPRPFARLRRQDPPGPSKYLLNAPGGRSMASAMREVKEMDISPMRFMYSVNVSRKLGKMDEEGHWLGARRLSYKGASGPGRGCSVDKSICSRWSIPPAVISAERRE
ncbi:hypothetical protein QC762_0028870 [Podospora pseudocomata]|uniref:Uncharacterized protein n=1 Tax=Podospora pseudocomata TaxID=2093779 RepID=A0ABR0GRZ1_9PEZI|nr:hypothetical protein QC762_0028870 [Podospora pseudocomata]